MTKIKNTLIFSILIAQLIHVPYNIACSNSSKNNIWYIGNKIGLPKYNHTVSYIDGIIICNNTNDLINNSRASFGTFIGYQTNQCFSFELGYNWLGKVTYTNEDIHNSLNIQNIDISTKLHHPIINNKTNIYTKVGGAIWHANIKNIYYNNTNTYHLNINDTNISPLFSLGIEYKIKKNWSTRLEYQKINNIGNINTLGAKANYSMFNINMLFYLT